MADHDAESSSSHFIYDVFLSFRGFTRYGFTDRLYHALCERGITTFRDDENLRVGDRIRDTLLEAIERSRMSIVVLCQNYASSSWCLDELVQIMKCSDKGTKRPVLPVFYQVEPSDVRHQRNQYEKDMMSHENRYCNDLNKVKEWRLALYEVCSLSGKHCAENSYESDVITNIVEEVSAKVPPEPLYIKHPIDFGSQFEVVESLLDTKSHDTLCMLILYGDVETEKSTFAGELYNKIKHQFQAASFLDKVRIKSRGIPNGLENLQEILLSGMCVHKKPRIGSTLKGSSDIKQSLHNKRVLLVLDDVDSIEQLDSLAGGSDWFGLGSRIIITTRDVKVLDKYELNGVKVMKYCIDEGEFKGMEGAKSNHEQDKDLQEDIVGFVEIFNEIVEKLKENESCTEVVSIIGMGGLGKTTLARKIYNNNEVKKLFSCCGWVTISKDYNAKDVLTSLVNGWGLSKSSEYKVLSEKEQKSKVQEHLDRNKYLIVVDDLWEPEVWDEVESLFPNNISGNKILITSHNDEVANYTRSKSYYPPFLDKNKSWKLFCKKVFGTQQCPPVLEPIGRAMVEKCGFLPLAIVTLAGIVAKKKRLTVEWMRIMRNVIWYLAKDNNGVMNVLKLSYDNLPQRLKPCFLYFAVFPEDYGIPAKQLIQLWIAEGLIQPPKSGTSSAGKLEDMAEEYLNELVDRSLVLVARKRSNGSLSVCRINDLLRDLCISESKADNEFEICTERDMHFMDMKKFCRLSLRSPEFVDSRSFTNQCSHSRIHSLMCFGYGDKSYHWDVNLLSFISARVLDFGTWSIDLSAPRDLNALIRLKYLRMDQFPSCHVHSLYSLPKLETLEIKLCSSEDLPRGLWKLKLLRHLCDFVCLHRWVLLSFQKCQMQIVRSKFRISNNGFVHSFIL